MHARFLCRGALVLALLAGASGCGKGIIKVEAKVTLDGKPVEGATVSLIPVEGKGAPAAGMTGTDGTVKLTMSSGDGVQPGEYKVLVSKVQTAGAGTASPAPGSPEYVKAMKEASAVQKPLLPDIYGNPSATPLTLKVPPDGPVEFKLDSKAK